MLKNILEAFSNINEVFSGEQEKESIICVRMDRISVPRDHGLSIMKIKYKIYIHYYHIFANVCIYNIYFITLKDC